MKVALFAQDDSAAAECLGPLAASGCKVLGVCGSVSAGEGAACSVFARRCVEQGFGLLSSEDDAMLSAALESFKPDLAVAILNMGEKSPAALAASSCPRRYLVTAGAMMSGALWPEFAPIWLAHDNSRVEVVAVGGAEVASATVPVTFEDTALSLRAKHAAAAAELLVHLLKGEEGLPKTSWTPPKVAGEAPSSIKLEWDLETVNRFIRARNLPPHDPAVAEDPEKGETYFIESMDQYREFCAKVLNHDSEGKDGANKVYAADTHWYSNVGGSIIKLTDSDIHMPVKTSEKKRTAVIPGASMTARKKLRMNEPLIGLNAERYCSTALASSWIGVEGPYVKRFEKQLATICGCNAACAVQSGTAALYGAMKALGVSDASHHVLVPSFTCAACADAIVHAGGRPIPIDCELESFGVSLEAVQRGLENDKDVVGVVLAPCYGVPCRDFLEIVALCKEKGLWICEDACESYGAAVSVPTEADMTRKVPLGSMSTLCVISVRSEKMIGVGEGGAILGNDTTLVARAKWWCSRAPSRGAGLWRVYKHDAVGQNFRLPEMLAAVGSAAAEMLPLMKERKTNIHRWYEEGIAARPALQGIRLQKANPGDVAVWWINAALLPEGLNGEKVGMQLMKDYPDIEIRPGFYPLNTMEIFKSPWVGSCPNAELLYQRLVCLPSSNLLTKEDIERVCDALAASVAAQ